MRSEDGPSTQSGSTGQAANVGAGGTTGSNAKEEIDPYKLDRMVNDRERIKADYLKKLPVNSSAKGGQSFYMKKLPASTVDCYLSARTPSPSPAPRRTA